VKKTIINKISTLEAELKHKQMPLQDVFIVTGKIEAYKHVLELLGKCPFCNGDMVLKHKKKGWIAKCADCGIRTKKCATKKETWNCVLK